MMFIKPVGMMDFRYYLGGGPNSCFDLLLFICNIIASHSFAVATVISRDYYSKLVLEVAFIYSLKTIS
jgi:hypothetical protein